MRTAQVSVYLFQRELGAVQVYLLARVERDNGFSLIIFEFKDNFKKKR